MIGYSIQLGNTRDPLVFPLISPLNHLSPATGLSPAILLSKAGGAYSAALGAVTEILDNLGNHMGMYSVAPNATDANTEGLLALRVQAASGNDPQDIYYYVVNFDPINEPASIWSYGQRTVTGAAPVLYVTSPLANSGDITVSRRHAYLALYGNALMWTVPSPSLVGATIQLSIRQAVTWSVISTGSYTGTAPNQSVTVELSNTVMSSLNIGSFDYVLEAAYGSSIIPLATGSIIVEE